MEETRFQLYLDELGPVNARRSAAVAAPLRHLHRQILEHFASTGQGPTEDDVRGWAARAGIDIRQALTDLAAADLIETDGDSGRIRGAYPFTAYSSGHRVDIAGGPAVHAYCAIDALGIPAMLERDASITSRDPHSGAEIRIRVHAAEATWTPAGAVVSVPAAGALASADQPAADACCPTVSFYASAEAARAYQQQHGLTLEVLTVPQALRFASAAFGPLLRPGDR